MRLLLPLFLSGCCTTPAPSGVVELHRLSPDSYYTGYARTGGGYVSLFHGARQGEEAELRTKRGLQRLLVRETYGDVVVVYPADLRRGDSGAPLFDMDGNWIGAIEGRRK